MTKRTLVPALALAFAATAAAPLSASAQEGPWLVRVRAVHLDSVNKDSTGLGLSINNRWIPELDVSYFFTPQISAELVLTYPQKQDLGSATLSTKVGTFKHLPPTLLAQYHFTGLGGFTPYVGAGVNYTRFSDVDFIPGVAIDKSSVGLALQLGVDVPITKTLSFNVDVKKVQIRTDVKLNGPTIGELKVDPLLVGVGLGWRF